MFPDLEVAVLIVLASHNPHKRQAIAMALGARCIPTIGADSMGLPEPVEDGQRFVDNAAIKARAAARATGLLALADDSGLVVPVLDGGPGVVTADWADTPHGRDWDRAMDRIHEEVAARGAAFPTLAVFVATLVLARPDGATKAFTHEQGGHAVWPPRHGRGFALDPIFAPFGSARTLAEMDDGEAALFDHRARAAEQVASWLMGEEGRAFADVRVAASMGA